MAPKEKAIAKSLAKGASSTSLAPKPTSAALEPRPTAPGDPSSSSCGGPPLLAASQVAARPPRRRLNRRGTEEAAERALALNFPGWNAMTTDQKLVNGQTLRQRIIADKRLHKGAENGPTRLGANYWRGLREAYGDAGVSGDCHLVVQNPRDQVRDSLVEAITGATTGNCVSRSKAPLKQWLLVESRPNQRELVGLMKATTASRPSTSPTAAALVVALATYIAKHKLHVEYPSEWHFFRFFLDEALVCLLGNMKRERLSLEDFWTKHFTEASLLLDAEQVRKVLQASSSWSSVGAELRELSSTTLLGRKMFEGAVRLLASEEYGVALKDILRSLQDPKQAVTGERVEAAQAAMNKAATDAARGSHLLGRREIEVDFMQLRLKIIVASTHEECNVRLASCLKEMTIGKPKGLPALTFEEALAGEAGSLDRPKVDEAILTPFRAARAAATDLIMDVSTGSEASALLEARKAVYVALDSTFGVELATAKAISGEAGQALVEKLAMACMPSSSTVVTLPAATRQLAALAAGDLYRMTSRSAQASVNSLREIVASFTSGVMPHWHSAETEFVVEAKTRSLWFASWAAPVVEGGASEDAARQHRGPAALKANYEYVEKHFLEETEDVLGLHDVELLFLHSWTLDAEERATLRGWTDKLVSRVGGGTCGAAAGSGAPPQKRGRISRKATQGRAKDENAAEDVRKTMTFFA